MLPNLNGHNTDLVNQIIKQYNQSYGILLFHFAFLILVRSSDQKLSYISMKKIGKILDGYLQSSWDKAKHCS